MMLQKRSIKYQKRTIKCLFCVAAFLTTATVLLFSGFFEKSVCCADDPKTNIYDDLHSNTASAVENLNLDAFEKFLKSLDAEQREALSISSVSRALLDAINGGSKNFFNSFFEVLLKALGQYFIGLLPALLTIFVVCLLKSMLSGMTSDFLDNSTTDVVHVVCYSVVVVVLITGITSAVQTVVDTMDGLAKFSDAVFPLLLTTLSALGGATGVATYQPLMAALTSGVMSIVTKIIVPAFIACVIFSVVGNMSDVVKLTKLPKLFRSGATWLIGIVFGLYCAFLTAGGISGGVADKLSYNAAKFALSSYVPILGGYLSDGFDLVTASLVLVKNALGYTSSLILAAVVLFPLLKLVAYNLCLRLTAALVEPIGDERVSKLLSSVADSLNLLVTALAGVGFMFFVLLMLIIGTYNPAI